MDKENNEKLQENIANVLAKSYVCGPKEATQFIAGYFKHVYMTDDVCDFLKFLLNREDILAKCNIVTDLSYRENTILVRPNRFLINGGEFRTMYQFLLSKLVKDSENCGNFHVCLLLDNKVEDASFTSATYGSCHYFPYGWNRERNDSSLNS